MEKVGCLVNLTELILDYLGGSVTKVDLSGAVKKKGDFGLCISSDAFSVSLCFRSR